VLDKSSPIEAVFETIRAVGAETSLIGPIPPHVMRAGASLIDPQDQSIFGLAVAGEPPDAIAAVLGMDANVVKRRIRSIVKWLRPRPRAEPQLVANSHREWSIPLPSPPLPSPR
jgi:hypothetical protein